MIIASVECQGGGVSTAVGCNMNPPPALSASLSSYAHFNTPTAFKTRDQEGPGGSGRLPARGWDRRALTVEVELQA